ncbi:MAG TPA: hypothetical protein VGO37_05905 [Steroidobacteraceae bacterium]|jgi:hypothetical protein|nr:hypothetical protein [Steroidobacteraceae bacterium]
MKPTLMQGTLDDVANHQTIGQVSTAVGAKIRGSVEAVGRVVDGVGAPGEIESNDIFGVDIRSSTYADPFGRLLYGRPL